MTFAYTTTCLRTLVSLLPLVGACGSPAEETCEELVANQAGLGAGETPSYESDFAPFAQTYCLRCHDSVEPPDVDPDPLGTRMLHWDQTERVADELVRLRFAVGERQFMPPTGYPQPTCEERQQITRWIDEGAPGVP